MILSLGNVRGSFSPVKKTCVCLYQLVWGNPVIRSELLSLVDGKVIQTLVDANALIIRR